MISANANTISIKDVNDNRIIYSYNNHLDTGLVICEDGINTPSRITYDAYVTICDSEATPNSFNLNETYTDTNLISFCLKSKTNFAKFKEILNLAGRAGDSAGRVGGKIIDAYYRKNKQKINKVIHNYVFDNVNDPKHTKILSITPNYNSKNENGDHSYLLKLRGKNYLGAYVVAYYNITINSFKVNDFSIIDEDSDSNQ